MKLNWAWVKNDKNRDILKMSAAGLAALVAAGWAVLTFVVDRHPSTSVTAGAGGMAAGHDISGNTFTLGPATPAINPSPPSVPATRLPP